MNGAALVSPSVALYTVATVVPLRDALVASAVTAVPLGVLTAVFNPFGTFSGSFPVFLPLVAVATSVGVAVANSKAGLATRVRTTGTEQALPSPVDLAAYRIIQESLVAGGLSNDDIAAELFLSPLTAKTHVSRIMTKLDAHDRASWSSPRTRPDWSRRVAAARNSESRKQQRTPLTANPYF